MINKKRVAVQAASLLLYKHETIVRFFDGKGGLNGVYP